MNTSTIPKRSGLPGSSTRLSYKFQRLREAIREAIVAGQLGVKLPGERELARRFGVNAKTISKALTDLTSEGLLVRQVGRGTFVAGTRYVTEEVVGTARRYAYLASDVLDPGFCETLFEMSRNRLKSYGHELKRFVVSPDEREELAERCLPISELKDLAGILVQSSHPSAGLLADLARRHIPVVLCDVGSSLVKTNAVVADYARGAFELTEHLALLGHTRIQPMLDGRHPRASAEFQRGYQTAMGRNGLEPQQAVWGTDVSSIRLPPGVTGAVCLGGRVAVGLKKALGLDKRAGATVSLAAMAEPGRLTLQQELITSYDVFPDRILDWAIRMLFDSAPGSPPREVIVPGLFNDRGSTYAHAGGSAPKPTPHTVL